jgi:hypothetical protein
LRGLGLKRFEQASVGRSPGALASAAVATRLPPAPGGVRTLQEDRVDPCVLVRIRERCSG